MRISHKAGVYNAMGGIPPVPTSWTRLTTYTANATYTIPSDGWYRIHCIGKGGDGGNGAAGYGSASGNGRAGGAGAGGGSGAYACHVDYYTAGQQITITYNTTYARAACPAGVQSSASSVTANHGGNGGVGTAATSSAHGTAGTAAAVPTASGGNVLSVSGGKGVDGDTPGAIIGGNYGKGGNGGARPSGAVYMGTPGTGGNNGSRGDVTASAAAGKAGAQGTYTANTVLGAAGGGGGGGGYRSNNATIYAGASGAAGRTGGIVIERGV